jgi:hypothetical protein
MQVLARDPVFVDAWVNLGALRKAVSDLVSAERFYDHALGIEPKHPTALFNLALLVTEQGAASRALFPMGAVPSDGAGGERPVASKAPGRAVPTE